MDKQSAKKSFLPWFRKYSPDLTKEVIGQDTSVNEIKKFIHDYKKQKKKALLVYGPTGCGKTVAIYAVADELGLEIVEVNASDFRNEEGLNSIVGNAISQYSLFSKSKVILVDEIDGIAGTEDRG